MKSLNRSDSIQTGQFGSFCPFWTKVGDKVFISNTAEAIYEVVPSKDRYIDPTAVYELMQYNYMLGQRTLIQGVYRMPNRATLNGKGEISRNKAYVHGKERKDALTLIIKTFLMTKAIKTYCGFK